MISARLLRRQSMPAAAAKRWWRRLVVLARPAANTPRIGSLCEFELTHPIALGLFSALEWTFNRSAKRKPRRLRSHSGRITLSRGQRPTELTTSTIARRRAPGWSVREPACARARRKTRTE